MSARHLRWLYDELPKLVAAGVLGEEQARRLREHYGPLPASRGDVLLVRALAWIGALLVAAGALLVLSHQWADLSSVARAGIGVAWLLVALGLAAFASWRRTGSVAWREGTATLLVLAFGGCLAIVADAFSITEDESLLALMTLGGAIAVFHTMGARSAAALGAWSWMIWLAAKDDADAFVAHGFFLAALALIALLLPGVLAPERDPRRAGWLEGVFGLAFLFGLVPGIFVLGVRLDDLLWIQFAYLGAGYAALHALAGWLADNADAVTTRAFEIAGAAGTVGVAWAFGFEDPWTSRGMVVVSYPVVTTWLESAAALASYALVAAGTFGLAVVALGRARRRAWPGAALLLVPVALALLGPSPPPLVAAIAMNVLLAIFGATALVAGLRVGRLTTANAGIAVLVAVILARFFDAEWSVLARGAAFVALGVAVLALNLRLVRRRAREHGEQAKEKTVHSPR